VVSTPARQLCETGGRRILQGRREDSPARKCYRKIGCNLKRQLQGPLAFAPSFQTGTRETCAGWHVPDAPGRIGGRSAKLFDTLCGTQANLLLFAGVTPSVQTINALREMKRAVEPLASHLRVNNIFASEADAEQAGVTDENTIVDGTQYLQTAFGMHDPE
jgi:hypothetical protein